MGVKKENRLPRYPGTGTSKKGRVQIPIEGDGPFENLSASPTRSVGGLLKVQGKEQAKGHKKPSHPHPCSPTQGVIGLVTGSYFQNDQFSCLRLIS